MDKLGVRKLISVRRNCIHFGMLNNFSGILVKGFCFTLSRSARLTRLKLKPTRVQSTKSSSAATASYVQGFSPKPGVREYFYYIDHQGQLFLDDTKVKNFITCFKDKEFLVFFFKRLKINNTGKYEKDFPYVSPCGRELNYIRCDDRPIVYSNILTATELNREVKSIEDKEKGKLVYNGIGPKLTFDFQPSKLCMLPLSGRVYHPAPEKVGGVGLIKSSLAIEISPYFIYETGTREVDPPTHFEWQGEKYKLDNDLWELMTDEDIADEESC